MERIIKLFVLLVVLAIGFRHGLPWLQERFGDAPIPAMATGKAPEQVTRCLRSLRTVRDQFEATRDILSNRREKQASLESAIVNSRETCACRHKTCAKGNEILDIFDKLASGDTRDPTVSLDRADAMYDEAKKLSRQKN